MLEWLTSLQWRYLLAAEAGADGYAVASTLVENGACAAAFGEGVE